MVGEAVLDDDRTGDGMTRTRETWQERERRRQEAVREARSLPRERADALPRAVLWLTVAAWLGVLVWLALTLPDRVPTHWSFSGVPDGWSSRAGALTFAVGLPLLLVLPMLWLSRLVFLAPDLVNSPHRDWWTATPRRVVRFERLVREDLMLIVAVTLALLVSAAVVIGYAAHQPRGEVPLWIFPATLVGYLALLGLVMVRMYRGDRYRPDADDPELADRTDP